MFERRGMLREKISFRPRKSGKTWLKQTLPHIFLVVLVVLYLLGGALIFQSLEVNGEIQRKARNLTAVGRSSEEPLRALLEFLSKTSLSNLSLVEELRLEDLLSAVGLDGKTRRTDNYSTPNYASRSELEDWTVLPASITFAFTAVSTIGYGHLYPTSNRGRWFCIIYTLIGIPLFMITVANIGKFAWEATDSIFRSVRKIGRKVLNKESVDERPLSLLTTAPLLLCGFALYILGGAFLLPQWEELEFFEACYFCFITLTTIGFGDIVPRNAAYVIPTLIYIFFGLAITTLAIEVLAAILRKVHYLGRQIRGAGSATVWLGGKLLTVNDLIRSIGREFGASEGEIRGVDRHIDQLLDAAADELAQTGCIDISHCRSRVTSLSVPPRNGTPTIYDDRNSGRYDNVPESWSVQNIPFIDESTRYPASPKPTMTLSYKYG